MRVLIFGGPDEEPLKQALAGHVGAAALVVDCMPLKTTAALLQRCRCFLTNDSGLMHVAVAMGVQTFALFGPSDPGRTRPWGERHTVLSKGMACSPCWSIRNLGVGRVPCIYDKNKCMLELTGEHAADQILQHLAAVESGQERHHGI